MHLAWSQGDRGVVHDFAHELSQLLLQTAAADPSQHSIWHTVRGMRHLPCASGHRIFLHSQQLLGRNLSTNQVHMPI